MNPDNYRDYVIEQLKRYTRDKIEFSKRNFETLLKERGLTKENILNELENPINLKYAHKQVRKYDEKEDIRFRIYFIYSNRRARCYVLRFNRVIKVITVIPIGRKTLNKYKKKLLK